MAEKTYHWNCSDLSRGIDNLLQRCVKIGAGETLLLVGETGEDAYYDTDLCMAVKQAADGLGAVVQLEYARPVADGANIPHAVLDKMIKADATVFFSRLGDQTRFTGSPGTGKKVMCYTLTKAHLGSSFATIDHNKMTQMLELLEAHMLTCDSYRIRTRCGTDLVGEIIANKSSEPTREFHLELFPVMIFEPIRCRNLNGSMTISGFITSTSTRAYENSVLKIDAPVKALVKDSMITSFEGDGITEQQVIRQLEKAAELTGGDPYAMHSWHTGINPGTFYEGTPFDNLEKWGTVAYGSPRYTHFHGAGLEPGDAAYSLMDATIEFDGEPIWQDGRFLFLDKPEVRSLLTPPERAVLNSRYRLDIGI